MALTLSDGMIFINIRKLSRRALQKKVEGFTLVELMIALVVSGFIMAALYSAYVVNQKQASVQEQVSDMQQNLRAGMNYLINEVRLAGFDPTGGAKAGIVLADKDAIIFTADLNGDGNTNKDNDDTDENVGYDIYLSPSTGFWTLGRAESSKSSVLPVHQPLAENIEKIEFLYLNKDDEETTVLTEVSSLRISMLARASQPDRNFTNAMTYYPASYSDFASGIKWGPYGDNFRRRLLITSVQLRNMGLEHE